MTLWIALASMTALAAVAVLWPFARPSSGAGAVGHDLSVYRDQLSEIDRDLERGVVGPAEAEAARLEISRRILRAARDGEDGEASAPRAGSRLAGVSLAVLVAAVSVGAYLSLGSPKMPDQPLVARLEAPLQNQSIEGLIARVEAHLGRNPNDGEGWEVLAPVYMRLGRVSEAITAWQNTIRLKGASVERQSALGEALVVVNGGVVVAEARQAFEAARALDPKAPLPRMYLALALSQDGKLAESVAAWKALIAEAPADAPWRAQAEAELARVETELKGGEAAVAPAPGPGPTPDQAAALQALPQAEQMKTIEAMVASLADRLKTKGGTPDEWLRLVRSYATLGKGADARAALVEARRALATDAPALARFEALMEAAGLKLEGAGG